MYNLMHGHALSCLTDMFMLNNSVHDYHTRSCINIHVKTYNLSLGQHIFAYRDAKLWDTISECIKNGNSVKFKTFFKISPECYVQSQAFPIRYVGVIVCIWQVDCLDSFFFCMFDCGSGNSSDHISHNQIFTVIVLKYMSWSSLPVKCGRCPSLPVRWCIKCKYCYAIVIIYLTVCLLSF